MKRGTLPRTVLGILALLIVGAATWRTLRSEGGVPGRTSVDAASALEPIPDVDPGYATDADPSTPTAGSAFIYGRVVLLDGPVYEGRLRWGRDEEALWGNHFNGVKNENRWAEYAPADELPTERVSIGAFGIEVFGWDRRRDLGRPFLARFGDIALIEPRGDEIRVTLKSGSSVDLDRFASDDLADGLRVWDATHGVVDLGEWRISTIEFLPAPPGPAAEPLYGTVHTAEGEFTGLIQWNRERAVSDDELRGHGPYGEVGHRFDAIRSIARGPSDASTVTLLDGREVVLSGTADVGAENRGLYVDDPRYGRVLIAWDTFERVDFSSGGRGSAYADFAPGRPLMGSVTTRSGRRLAGRLVFDLDESETTETLDAPSSGVDYMIPFDLVQSIVLPELDDDGEGPALARVSLVTGADVRLERAGDLGELNAGMLIFSAGSQQAEYVPWSEVQRVVFEGPGPASNRR